MNGRIRELKVEVTPVAREGSTAGFPEKELVGSELCLDRNLVNLRKTFLAGGASCLG